MFTGKQFENLGKAFSEKDHLESSRNVQRLSEDTEQCHLPPGTNN